MEGAKKIINDLRFMENIKLFTEQEMSEVIRIGHPYRPENSAILFMKQGEVQIKEQITPVTITGQSFAFINRKYVYEITEVSEDVQLWILSYPPELMERIFPQISKPEVYRNLKKQHLCNFSIEDDESDVLWKTLEVIGHYLPHPQNVEYIAEIIENHFNGLAYHLMGIVDRDNQELRDKMSRAEMVVHDFVLLVSDHYLEDRSVNFYSERLLITNRHLSTLVKQETGKTPGELIAVFLLNEARAQLSDMSNSISEIAFRLKFSDQYSFSHFFKKHLKISPTQYRKRNVCQIQVINP